MVATNRMTQDELLAYRVEELTRLEAMDTTAVREEKACALSEIHAMNVALEAFQRHGPERNSLINALDRAWARWHVADGILFRRSR